MNLAATPGKAACLAMLAFALGMQAADAADSPREQAVLRARG
jgi:hypothetical protein